MKKLVVILCRYEYWGKRGKRWTKWFIADSTPRSLSEATKKIVELKSDSARTSKITKLGYEYKTRFC